MPHRRPLLPDFGAALSAYPRRDCRGNVCRGTAKRALRVAVALKFVGVNRSAPRVKDLAAEAIAGAICDCR